MYDEESIKYFYDNLYLPYLRQRFGGAFETVDLDWLSSVAKDSGLLRILDGDRNIAGVVLDFEEGYLDWIWTGALTGKGSELENGAFSALYYHSIKYAHENGFPLMKMNNTRAFLTDGLYRYKRKWGARLTSSRSRDTDLLLDFDLSSEAVQKWLESSPFLSEHDGGFCANIFCFSNSANCDDLVGHIQDFLSPGISRVNIHSTRRLDGLPERIDSCVIRYIALAYQDQ